MKSHLMAADDILFGRATIKQMGRIPLKMSVQRINIQKTSILFSKNVDRGMISELVRISGFRDTGCLGNNS